MSRFKVFIEGISSYLQDVEGVNLGDRMALRDLWQSYPDDDESVIVDQSGERLYRMASEEEWFQDIDAMLGGQKPKTKPVGKATGIALRLEQVWLHLNFALHCINAYYRSLTRLFLPQ